MICNFLLFFYKLLSTEIFNFNFSEVPRVPMHISFHIFVLLVLFSLCIILKFSMFMFFITQITRIKKYKHRKIEEEQHHRERNK